MSKNNKRKNKVAVKKRKQAKQADMLKAHQKHKYSIAVDRYIADMMAEQLKAEQEGETIVDTETIVETTETVTEDVEFTEVEVLDDNETPSN